jgi:ferrochelatase
VIGVLVMAHGTPARREDIEGFYTRIRRGRPPSAEEVAELTRRYEAIGGLSPFAARTEAQVAGLRAALPDSYVVELGQKFAEPEIPAAVERLIAAGVERIVGIVLAPHYAEASVGDYIARAEAAVDGRAPLDVVRGWHAESALIELLARRVREVWIDGATLVVTAHSLPLAALRGDDTYADALAETAQLLAKAATVDRFVVAWQSAGKAGGEWLGPSVLDVIREATTPIVVCAAGFTSEHLEIAYDLDIEAAAVARDAGVAFARTRSLDDDPAFCALLADLVTRR